MKVINIQVARLIKNKKLAEESFRSSAARLPKAELLQAMLTQDEVLKLNPTNIQATIRAQILLEELEKKAELNYLKSIANEYKRKLAHRLYSQIKSIV